MVDVWVLIENRVKSLGRRHTRWEWFDGACRGGGWRRVAAGSAWDEWERATWPTAVDLMASGTSSACGACGRARTTAAAWRRQRARSGSRSTSWAPRQHPRPAPPRLSPCYKDQGSLLNLNWLGSHLSVILPEGQMASSRGSRPISHPSYFDPNINVLTSVLPIDIILDFILKLPYYLWIYVQKWLRSDIESGPRYLDIDRARIGQLLEETESATNVSTDYRWQKWFIDVPKSIDKRRVTLALAPLMWHTHVTAACTCSFGNHN